MFSFFIQSIYFPDFVVDELLFDAGDRDGDGFLSRLLLLLVLCLLSSLFDFLPRCCSLMYV